MVTFGQASNFYKSDLKCAFLKAFLILNGLMWVGLGINVSFKTLTQINLRMEKDYKSQQLT
jgi:hypothetical protein